MKKLKQIFTMIFTMIFIVGACLSAYAADTKGIITITNDPASTGASMVGHTYSVYRVFDLTMSGDAISYTVNDDFKDYFKGKADSTDDVSSDTKLNEFAKEYITEANKNTVAKELLKYATDETSPITPIKTTDKSNVKVDTDKKESVEITGLDLGYYLVVDNGRQGDETPKSAVALAAMGTTDTNLDITLKASAPTIDKEIKHNESGDWGNVGDNQIGDNVEYRFISTIPDTTGYTSYEYIIHDKMTEGLTFNNDIEIYVGEKTEGSTNKLDASYYAVNPKDGETLTDGHTFDISIDVKKGINDNKFKAGDELYIYFSATLNEKAVVAGDHNDNTVYLEYSNNPYNKSSKDETPEVTVRDYTFKLNALKTKEDGKTPLAGAEFEIREGTQPLYFNKTTIEDADKKVTNVYTLCSVKHTHEGSSDCTTTIVSGSNGKFEIVGLDDATKYTIVETKAPDGYNAIKPIDFTITAEYDEIGKITSVTTDLDSIATPKDSFELGTTIVNTTDTLLPETGGIGTIIFTILGSVMMIFAAVVFIRKRHIG